MAQLFSMVEDGDQKRLTVDCELHDVKDSDILSAKLDDDEELQCVDEYCTQYMLQYFAARCRCARKKCAWGDGRGLFYCLHCITDSENTTLNFALSALHKHKTPLTK